MVMPAASLACLRRLPIPGPSSFVRRATAAQWAMAFWPSILDGDMNIWTILGVHYFDYGLF
jgi:hypothetical protein